MSVDVSRKLFVVLIMLLFARLWNDLTLLQPYVMATTFQPQQQATDDQDLRPVAPNGYLCVFGAKGRLNNLIIQNLVALYMAQHTNRTLLVDHEVASYYDIAHLSIHVAALPNHKWRAAMAMPPNETCPNPVEASPYTIAKQQNVVGRFENYHQQTRHLNLTSVDNNDIWYWLGRPPSSFYHAFFGHLQLQRKYASKVDDFLALQQQLVAAGRRNYHALHLRWLEGHCHGMADDKALCCPTRDAVMDIIQKAGGDASWPLLVASDGQCDAAILQTYNRTNNNNNNNNNSQIIMGYTGPCQGTECAVLDFALCVAAQGVFVGNTASTADLNIAEMRRTTRSKNGLVSIVSRTQRVQQLQASNLSISRHLTPGYWKWWPDCDDMTVQQRNRRPCA